MKHSIAYHEDVRSAGEMSLLLTHTCIDSERAKCTDRQ